MNAFLLEPIVYPLQCSISLSVPRIDIRILAILDFHPAKVVYLLNCIDLKVMVDE